ncbi:MAG: RNA pyrophosphohydrolase [Zavarzinia sp.]|nr:RNA pyrophosphohydrolase [Zavarzinia sp.]
MMDINALPYRPCVGIMLINPEGLVFVGQRIDNLVEAWQMPQGGIDEGEDPRTAALREMGEEIGTEKAEFIAESSGWLNYDLPVDLIPRVWKGRYRGQRQKWFAMRFLGTDADINIETSHPEFAAWRWVEHQALPDLIVPFKRDLYREIVAEFAPLFAERAR